MRLNPFFIRSAVEMNNVPDKEAEMGLNPFFIRSAVEMQHHRRCGARRCRLNPFFIRSAVEIQGYRGQSPLQQGS